MIRARLGVMAAVGLVAASLGVAGCAQPQVHGATQVGGHETATWVYVSTDDRDLDGIFRCVEASGQVVCKRARIEK